MYPAITSGDTSDLSREHVPLFARMERPNIRAVHVHGVVPVQMILNCFDARFRVCCHVDGIE